MKLQTLKPTLQRIGTRLQAQPAGQVERKRGSAGVRDRHEIRRRDCGLCQVCKAKGLARPGYIVDHIVPLWSGGSDEPSNKQTICEPCHDEKTALEAKQRARGD